MDWFILLFVIVIMRLVIGRDMGKVWLALMLPFFFMYSCNGFMYVGATGEIWDDRATLIIISLFMSAFPSLLIMMRLLKNEERNL